MEIEIEMEMEMIFYRNEK